MDGDSSEWASEPIAIIGMSCRFSGGASDPEKFWDLMAAGKTGWSEIPSDRFNLKGIYHPNNERISTTHVKGGHFLDENVASFDAAFFNYSGEMAQALDPQYRMQLESTFEALENAGLPLPKVAGSKTSVFGGVFTHDYHEGLVRDEDRLPRFMVVGTWTAMSANRISHFFDFRGASMTLDTGCSTALVALHQAMQSLRSREADMSVVSGVNLMLNPDQFKSIGSLGMLSPDGKSYAFDERANGYGRGEGVATVIIKRLSDALAANDPIRAVIRETALNQDGKTDTITTPSGAAQEELMRECYRRAGLDPRGTQYFEAHGTGTQAGDPIEAGAMAKVFGGGEGRDDKENFLRIGSVKTNIGHTEAASGLAAIVKGVLCLEKGMIPPCVNYETPNPKLKLDEWHLKVATALEPFPESLIGGPRRLSVNNFGYGGTNAHVIMESADPWTTTPNFSSKAANGNGVGNSHVSGNGHTNGHNNGNTLHTTNTTDSAKVLILSARDERTCQRMVSDIKAYLEKHRTIGNEASQELLRDLSYTLCERRTLFQWVAAHQVRVEGDNGPDAVIQAFDSPRFKPGRMPSGRPRIGMVFTGQGAQWYAMGRELLTSYPVFRETIEEAETHLRAIGATWSLIEELRHDAKTTRVHETALSIPICVALQIALVRLLASWGIKPTAVTSHSSGEIAAAFAVGALTLRQAMATAYYRAVLAADETKRAPGVAKGAMAAVGLGAEEVQSYFDRLSEGSGKAVVACVNSPQSVTISGDADAIQEIEHLCKQDGVFARRLKVQQAYHSHHMDPFAEAYRELLRKEMARSVMYNGKRHLQEEVDEERELEVIFSSAVTGGRITDIKEIADPDHWVGSLVQPVQFVNAFTDMVLGDLDDPTGRSIDVVLEVGPHTALGGPIREILSLVEFEGIELPYWGCLVRDEHAGDTMRSAAINLLREGYPITTSQINFPVPAYDDESPRVLTDLPTYPWNHTKTHWQESRINRAIRERSQPPHDLLGMLVAGNEPDVAVWRRMLRVTETPWIRDHMVQGSIVYPGSGYICLAIEATNQLERTAASGEEALRNVSGFRLRDVEFLAALVVPDNADGIEIRTTLRPVPEREMGARGWRRFEVSSVTQENRWTLHARGMVTVEREGALETIAASTEAECRPLSAYTRQKDPRDMFTNLRALGIYHGPLFQNTTKIVQDGREPRSVCDITIQHESSTDTDPRAAARDTVLHPITLDAVVVSFFSTLPGVGAQVEDPKLPRSIESMWVSSHISREVGHPLRCDTSLLHDDPQSGRADITVVDGHTGTAVLRIQSLACVFLGRGSGATARQDGVNKGTSSSTKWQGEVCSKVQWGPDISFRQSLALVQTREQLNLAEPEMDTALVTNLLRVSVYFAKDALQTLTPEDIAKIQEQPHFAKYHGWLRELVDQAAQGASSLAPNSKGWALDGPEERKRHMTAAASQSVDGELLCRLGPLLVPILRGERSVEEIMREDGLQHRYYANSIRLTPSLTPLSTLLRKIAHKYPRARVLEIGNGTNGATTRRVLEALGTLPATLPVASWHVTEASSDTLEDTRAELAGWDNLLGFDQLDVEKDPAKQNFALESYDVVIASQISYNAKNISRAMANVRSLLKPGGTLLLVETTQNRADIELVFGLLPSWWQGEEPERQASPSFSTSSWDRILRDAGFNGVDIETRDSESDIVHANSTIVSTVPFADHQRPDLSRANNPGGFAVVTSNKTFPPPGLVDMLSQRIAALTDGTICPDHLVLEESSFDEYKTKICVFVGEVDEPILTDLDTARMDGLRAMVTQCSGLLWITTGGAVDSEVPEQALSQGFLRVLRNEYVGRRYLSLDLDPRVPERWSRDKEGVVSAIIQVLENGFGQVDDVLATEVGPAEFEYAERDGILLIPRIYKDRQHNDMVTGPLTPSWGEVLVKTNNETGGIDGAASIPLENFFQKDRPLRLEVGIPGHLDTLVFVDNGKDDSGPSPEIVEITPQAYGLSSRDVVAAMGQLKDRAMGLECAGIVTRIGAEARGKGYNIGDRVMALYTGASFSSRVHVPWHSIVHIPKSISFEDAASLPLVFTIAYAGLVDAARLVPGRSVLIHAASGGIGQAAIMLAKHLGVTEIYATAGSQEKRDYIRREYGIPAERIFNSRDVSFALAVLAATNGRGVDLVLNSLPGPLLQASLDVVAPLGHLIEIGKGEIEVNSLLAFNSFSRGISLTSLDILTLLHRRGPDVHRMLSEIARLVEKQVLKPVNPVTVYPIQDVQAAFRFVQTGAQMGKVVLSTRPDEQVWVFPRPKGVTPRIQLRPDASYLVVGGVGGIGRSVANWLVENGAKNLILLSRSAGDLDLEKNKSTDGALFVGELRQAGCRVKPVNCDISLASNLVKALLRGVIQGAMLLRDAIFEQMSLDDWRSGVRPKVDGTWNLHTEFSKVGSLDFFIMLSSVSGVLGIASQTNYAAGGSYEDAMARWRQARGLPGVSIDLGPIGDVGYVSETAKVSERLRKSGDYVMLDEEIVLRALKAAILHPLGETSSRDDGARLIGIAIATKLADIFMLDVAEIDLSKPPAQYGVDSLVAVELRNMLVLQAAADVSIFNILQSASLAALATDVAAKSQHIKVTD
ncbi:putative polyketide synthase [Hypomontagnella monticulosa]|nr:putative polyketide synthase [Hypomontagnella monticulosa]